MPTTKVKWLCDGKRQIERFGGWVWVKEGEVSDHPSDQLGMLKEGVHYERVSDKPASKPEPVAEAQEEEKAPESGSESVEETTESRNLVDLKAAKAKAPKKSGRRKIGKGKG